jgi:hypothetical protein
VHAAGIRRLDDDGKWGGAGPATVTDRSMLGAAFRRTELTPSELWLRYVALGGSADRIDVYGYVHGMTFLPVGEHDILAQVVNEALDELGERCRIPQARYTWRR